MDFIESLRTNFLAAGQVLILGCAGFYILRRGIMGECCLRTVSNLVIEVSLPCFMFTNIITNFHTVRGEIWYAFPFTCLAIFVLAAASAAAAVKLDKTITSKREFIAMTAFQNSGFLPIILADVLLPKESAAKVFIYTFLFLLFYNPVVFSISDAMFSGKPGWKLDKKSFFNAANTATAAALIIALLNGGRFVPDIIFKPMKMIGDTTIPLAMIVVGGIVMVNHTSRTKLRYGFIAKLAALKLIFLPLAVFAILAPFAISPEVRFFLVLEAMMPPGAILPLFANRAGGDYQLVGEALFATTILSLITIPFLLTLLRLAPPS